MMATLAKPSGSIPSEAGPPNARALRRDRYRETAGAFGLSLPGLLVVLVLLVAPMAWLFWLSAFDAQGQFTLENYERMLRPLYQRTFFTTFRVSLIVALVCAVIAYPMAYLMAQAGPRLSMVLMLCVMLPFWTSVLVRTYAWLVLLQRTGLINSWLQGMGITDAPLALVHNELGTIIGMVHVMLPFMILPLYASMKAVDPALMLAASNCGASPSQAFRQVYLPQTVAGLASGFSLVFVMGLGYFVTPVLLGGGRVNMWAQQISDNISLYGNWGAASALGVVLMVVTSVLLIGLNQILKRMGGR